MSESEAEERALSLLLSQQLQLLLSKALYTYVKPVWRLTPARTVETSTASKV